MTHTNRLTLAPLLAILTLTGCLSGGGAPNVITGVWGGIVTCSTTADIAGSGPRTTSTATSQQIAFDDTGAPISWQLITVDGLPTVTFEANQAGDTQVAQIGAQQIAVLIVGANYSPTSSTMTAEITLAGPVSGVIEHTLTANALGFGTLIYAVEQTGEVTQVGIPTLFTRTCTGHLLRQ